MIERYKRRRLNPREPVEVYRNLHRSKQGKVPWYSVRQHGLIIGHTQGIVLVGCTLVVQAAGRARVLATGHKNVHAWVSGHVVDGRVDAETWYAGRYNPHKSATFTGAYGGPLETVPMVWLGRGGLSYTYQWFTD